MVLESCHSTWIFDVAHGRFRRVLKGGPAGASTPWLAYFRLELDEGDDSFVVWLNADGTRRLRSWRHEDGCAACGEATQELELRLIRSTEA